MIQDNLSGKQLPLRNNIKHSGQQESYCCLKRPLLTCSVLIRQHGDHIVHIAQETRNIHLSTLSFSICAVLLERKSRKTYNDAPAFDRQTQTQCDQSASFISLELGGFEIFLARKRWKRFVVKGLLSPGLVCSLKGPAADCHLEEISSKLKAGASQKRERGSGSWVRPHHCQGCSQCVPGERGELEQHVVHNENKWKKFSGWG